MATARIRIPCNFWPNTTTNPNAYHDVLATDTNAFQSQGVVCPDGAISDVCFRQTEGFPATIHGTPNPKLRVTLWTTATGTNNYKLQWAANLITKGTTASNFTASFASGTVASGGQYVPTVIEFTLSGTPTTDKLYEGTLRRDGTDVADAIVGVAQIIEVLIVADDTT